MARWKLTRVSHGDEEFSFVDGEEITLGRGINNTICLSSIVVSRNHCVINAQANKVLITDLKSSNGIYVGLKKIPTQTPYTLKDSDIIGIGWTEGTRIPNINDQSKFMFKLSKEEPLSTPASSIKFESDIEENDIEEVVAALHWGKTTESNKSTLQQQPPKAQSLVLTKPPAKRKLQELQPNIKKEGDATDKQHTIDENVINILSDSDNESVIKHETPSKKPKLEAICEEFPRIIKEEFIKTERDELEYDAFKVKQEYEGYDDEPISIDSDSDDESVQWLIRLSQSSPGKPFTKLSRISKTEHEETSYSQIDDFLENDEDFIDDFISIPPQPPDEYQKQNSENIQLSNFGFEKEDDLDDNNFLDNLITLDKQKIPLANSKVDNRAIGDVVDGNFTHSISKNLETYSKSALEPHIEKGKMTQMIEPQVQATKSKSVNDGKVKSSSSKQSKEKKDKKQSSTKIHISNSQKEERKRKLKDIATKEKESPKLDNGSNNSMKEKVVSNVKVTSTNRGAFLTDVKQGVVQPVKRKESPRKQNKGKEKGEHSSPKDDTTVSSTCTDDIKNKKKSAKVVTDSKSSKHMEKDLPPKSKSTHSKSKHSESHDTRVPVKSLKPLSESEESFSGKPFSKVVPFPKRKKSVRFSEAPPTVHLFEIEEGNNMKKTSSVKTCLVDARQAPIFSLEKITLMKILRWNPHWLEEQVNNADPPPILGHNNLPLTILHSFNNHHQYVQVVGDLLLMEIWECLTQGYMRMRGQANGLEMRIASLPPVPTQDRCFELFNVSVNVSVPNSEIRTVPRIGEIILANFGPQQARNQRIFYVHNVRCLPSPPNNIHSFFCISLHSCYTDKMKSLKPGELMIGVSLAYIQKELMLFEAMDHLAGSPLSEAILTPEPQNFVKTDINLANGPQSQWTKTLNASQQAAVMSSVSAALGDKPCIQMVQGPPGTGKSSVICAIVMSYFYDCHGRRQQNRGKILICATSNAAVDELVIRLLDIRQKLPTAERFRMVRVGRAEAMHPRAHVISSQQLAQRDAAARHAAEPQHANLSEISHLEAKVNMWKTQEQDAKDPVRAAYCKGRVTQLYHRIALLRNGGGGAGEELAASLPALERRIIEGADIVVTTLASAHNAKMRGLRRRIALCIVDEAGQAIEPETLIPLTLDVTRLTLIGDPQQLPGFILSQRAKKHGLGESLFSRLAGCAEGWASSPVVLLNRQYRMAPAIADYPNRAFYANLVQHRPPPAPRGLSVPPYTILCIASGDKGQGSSGANEMEAWGVTRLVLALSADIRALALSLAVITPYNAHKELIKKNLRLLQDPSEPNIEVNTVDSFQGQERDVVVVSLARSQGLGFLSDVGRMNVMLTRARHALFVCLNPHAMLANYQWRTLVEDAQIRNLYRTLPNKFCQGPSAGKIPPSDILRCITHSKIYK